MAASLLCGVLVLSLASLLSASERSDDPPPEVDLKCGHVVGEWRTNSNNHTVASFRGIPYGAPPTGTSRWRPPRPAACWNGTLHAQREPRACIQWHSVDQPPQGQSEDCLYLNVFAPKAAKNLPVFAWLYGGDNCFGSTSAYGNLDNLIGEDFPAVIVTMNFRLAAFGFLALRELSESDPRGTSGNYAIMDVQLSLQWIQENIDQFGGDATHVTVIGQSSGGTNILALLASPSSRGLFHAAVSLSGSPNITMDLPTAERQGQQLLGNTTCMHAKDVVACLQNLPVADVLKATPLDWDYAGEFPSNPKGTPAGGLVIVDGATVTLPLPIALHSKLVDVPVIFQSMQGELDLFDKKEYDNWTVDEVHQFFLENFQPWGASIGEDIFDMYRSFLTPRPVYSYYAAGADIGVTCGNTEIALAAGRAFSSNVYLALVTQGPGLPFPAIPTYGRCVFPFHMWDYIAGFRVWDMFSRFGVPKYSPTEADIQLGALLRNMWYSLGVTGALPSRWLPVRARPAPEYIGLNISIDGGSVISLKNSTCARLREMGFDERFWWVNSFL